MVLKVKYDQEIPNLKIFYIFPVICWIRLNMLNRAYKTQPNFNQDISYHFQY